MNQYSLNPPGTRITAKDLLTAGLLSLGYLLLSYALLGFKSDQLVLVGIFNGLYFFSLTTRKFVIGFSIFIVFWILFDSMKAFPNYNFNTVHIESLYHAEKSLFGIAAHGTVVTPNEYFKEHGNQFLNILTGIFYLLWMPVPLGFAAYLFFKNKTGFLQFSLTFLLVNLIGFVIYYAYPAAPPWYVEQNGFAFIFNTPGNTAGLSSFDQFFGVSIFAALYSKSSNVFAAMPSLHSAYPLLVLYYGIKFKVGWINLFFGLVTIGIWFAAVYTRHHYVLDVIFGITSACVGIGVFALLKNKSGIMNRFLTGYLSRIQ